MKKVQVIHVTGTDVLHAPENYKNAVDAFLLDTAIVAEGQFIQGGTGRPHDWTISAEFRRRATRPVILAGGLNAYNIRAALEHVRPAGVDLCSSLRSNNELDPVKCEAFVAEFAAARDALERVLSH